MIYVANEWFGKQGKFQTKFASICSAGPLFLTRWSLIRDPGFLWLLFYVFSQKKKVDVSSRYFIVYVLGLYVNSNFIESCLNSTVAIV